MGGEETYRVVLQGCRSQERFREGLKKLKLTTPEIDRLLAAMPCTLRSRLSLVEAEKVKAEFRDAGGDVAVVVERATTPPPVDVLDTPAAPAPPPAREAPRAIELPEDTEPPLDLDRPPPSPIVPPVSAAPQARVVAPRPSSAPPDPEGPLVTFRSKTPAPAPKAPAKPTGTMAPAVQPVPLPPKPAVEWKEPGLDPRILRGVGAVFAILIVLGGLSCIGSYTVASRLHSFEATARSQLQQKIMETSRAGAPMSAEGMRAQVKAWAGEAKVDILSLDIVEEALETQLMRAPSGGPGGMESMGGPVMGGGQCVPAGPPPRGITVEQRMEWQQYVQACTPPAWWVGFRATVRAKWGWKKRTAAVDIMVFAWSYAPEKPPAFPSRLP